MWRLGLSCAPFRIDCDDVSTAIGAIGQENRLLRPPWCLALLCGESRRYLCANINLDSARKAGAGVADRQIMERSVGLFEGGLCIKIVEQVWFASFNLLVSGSASKARKLCYLRETA